MRIVTSYVNPDLDGVACALVYASYIDDSANPTFVGSPSREAAGVLERLNFSGSVRWATESDEVEQTDVVLVDCHHPAQLPHISDFSAVSVVIDHHPDGDAKAFPNAEIQNDAVGAAATLVAERIIFGPGISKLSPSYAALLAGAIASNTLDFSAPSTTERDHKAYLELENVAEPSVSLTELRQKMREWRNSFLALSTAEAVSKDCKLIETPFGVVAVSQLEGDNASAIGGRPGVVDALTELAAAPEVTASLLSLVDTAANSTTLITSDQRIRRALLELHPESVDSSTLRLPFLALRKTHIIPAITQAQT